MYNGKKFIKILKYQYPGAYRQNLRNQTRSTLSGSAFKLFDYLYCFGDGTELSLSRKEVIKCTGISIGSYANALKELEKYNYLQCTGENSYLFVETGKILPSSN